MFRSNIKPWATEDDNYDVELQSLADKVISGEMTRDEAQYNDLHNKYGYYGIDVSCDLDKKLREHAMSVAPEWTAYQRKCINMLVDGYGKESDDLKLIRDIMQELKDGQIGITEMVEKLDGILNNVG